MVRIYDLITPLRACMTFFSQSSFVQGVISLTRSIFVWGGTTTNESFHVANRNVHWLLGAFSLAAAWFWVFAFYVGPQQAYTKGWPGLLWFATWNAVAIALSCLVARKIRARMQGTGITLPEFHEHTYDRRVRIISAFAILIVQGIYSVIAQLIGARILLSSVTDYSPFTIGMILPGVLFLVVLYASHRGLPNSLGADALKALLLTMIAVPAVVLLVIFGDDALRGLTGLSGNPPGFFGGTFLMEYVVPLAISLLAGAAIDQQLYQRGYALSPRHAGRALLLAPLIFFVMCIGVGSLGFLAAGWGLQVSDSQVVGFEVIKSLFSDGVATAFVFAIAAILIATGVAALNAVSSVGANDFARTLKPDVSDATLVWVSRGVMVFFVCVCMAIYFFYPKIQLLQLLLFAGAFRVALLLPTIMGAFTTSYRPTSRAFSGAIVIAMVVGVWTASGLWPVYPFALSPKQVFYGGLAALGITAIACAAEWYRSRKLAS